MLEVMVPISDVRQQNDESIKKIFTAIETMTLESDALLGCIHKNAIEFTHQMTIFLNQENQQSHSIAEAMKYVGSFVKANHSSMLGVESQEKKIKQIALYLFGKNKDEQKETLNILRFWSEEKGKEKIHYCLKEHFQKMNEIALIPFKQFLWTESKQAKFKLSDISLRECVRAWISEKHVIFDEVKINGLSLLPFTIKDNEKTEEFKKRFFEKLLSSLKQNEKQASIMVQAYQWDAKNPEDLLQKLPVLPFLQLSSPSAWNLVHESLFSELVGSKVNLNNTKAEQNIKLSIELVSESHFKVTQTKTYKTYRQKNAKDEWSAKFVDKNADLCEFIFTWTFYPVLDQGRPSWQALFNIPKIEINGNNATDEERAQIFETFIQSETRPPTPRLRSSLISSGKI